MVKERLVIMIIHVKSTLTFTNASTVEIIHNHWQIESAWAFLILEFILVHETSISMFKGISVDSNTHVWYFCNIAVWTLQINLFQTVRGKNTLHTTLSHIG